MTRSSKTRRFDESRGFTLVELLVVIAIIAIIAGLVVPSLMDAQGSAYEVQCMSNLKGLHQTGYAYSQGTSRRFPFARGMKNPPAHESFNVLLDSRHGQSLEPETFVCPEGQATVAISEPTGDGSREFLLDDYSNSYTWVNKPTSPTRKTVLSSDKYYGGYQDADGVHGGHKSALMVIDTTGAAVKLELTPDGEPVPGSKYTLTEEGIPPGLTR